MPVSCTTDAVLIEAEHFTDYGGWLPDSQHMDQMGSTYLLAHGNGQTVADATSTCELGAGNWQVWVRTRNWTAAQGVAMGRFQLCIDGQALPTEFGTEGPEWQWQDGGRITLPAGQHQLRLVDRTGFAARCDAICFTAAGSAAPPNGPDLDAWRRQCLGLHPDVDDTQTADLVVVGGGIAGICAALTAAREGLSVILIQDRPMVGGNSSPEIRVSLNSNRNLPLFERLGDVVAEIEDSQGSDALHAGNLDRFEAACQTRMQLLTQEPNITLHCHYRMQQAEVDQGIIQSITATHCISGHRLRIQAPLFVDASGDGNLGHLVGADARYGREARSDSNETLAPETRDTQVLGSTLHWLSEDSPEPCSFADCQDWGLVTDEASCQHALRGAWNWEAGFFHDMVDDAEQVRDLLLRAIYSNWSFQVNHSLDRDTYRNKRISWVGHILGKRESRRLLGPVVYAQQDIEAEPGRYHDECVGCAWGIDLHYPDPDMAERLGTDCFRSVAGHNHKNKHPLRYLPYRCFFSRNINNLFMAGRCVSMTHVAHGYFRNQRTTGMMGEVVGLAAALATQRSCLPRDLAEDHWPALNQLLHRGAKTAQICKPEC